MDLRDERIERTARLPDGREILVRVGVPYDPYVERGERDTVAVELLAGGEGVAYVPTVLDAADADEARALAEEITAGLEAGELEPTAGAIAPLATRAP